MDQYSKKSKTQLIEELVSLHKKLDAQAPSGGDTPAGIIQTGQENNYHHVFEQIDDGYWEVDLAGQTTYCNQAMARITGYTVEEMIGLSYSNYMEPNVQREVYRHFNSVFRGEAEKKTLLYNIVTKDMQSRIVEISVSLIKSPAGKPVGFRGIMRDITDRQRDMDLQESFNMMRKALGQTVQALSLAIEVRDPYTAGHHRRVSDLARSIATAMGISRESIDGIRIAGSIHDIGKISIPSEILSKPAKLTDIEFRIIQTHPQMGYDILKNIDFPWPVAMAVYQHHERINGTGYPRGLKGTEMILEAKILAVADVVEAMSSYRPYRRAIGIDDALVEIRNNSGTLYDPEVTEACLDLFKSGSYILKD
ncbi:MAG: PAS domain S-box protein [Spirochaetes bacterium]|nr:PAS domain S-box protein [Spirochaetota bacterium]HOD15551.1 PAS domain S-box protein [Spirochaetota bacterium]HPG49230.1 PAS domain S-box protein [Spirochaetota bacterium]